MKYNVNIKLNKVVVVTSLILFFCGSISIAQKKPLYIALSSFSPESNDIDLRQLDGYFEKVQIVGMGESTHGTHEFFTMRHRMFKYLVEYHKFTTFFLEADYANCLRANRYIHGEEDDVVEVVREIGLWPWITDEMVDLVEWMRENNQLNPNNQLNFVGVDMQDFNNTLKEIDKILVKYGLPPTDTVKYPPISNLDFIKLKKKPRIKNLKALVEEKNGINISVLNERDLLIYKNLLRFQYQIIGNKITKETNYRDRSMGENILFFLNEDSLVKGFFWAHNVHIFRVYFKKKQSGAAGGVVNDRIGDKYFIIGQEFDKGSFNVYYPDDKSINQKIKGWTLGVVEVGDSPEGSFASNFRKIDERIIFIPIETVPATETVRLNNIGANFKPSDNPKSKFRNSPHGRENFDAIILFKESTPTHLIKKTDNNR